MKLTILGNNGPFPSAGGACSSYLLEAGALKILIDMGSGSLSELQKKFNIMDIDVIILTHLHYDHVADIFVLKYAYSVNKKGLLKKPILFMPQQPSEQYKAIKDSRFEIVDINNGLKKNISDVQISFIKVPHPVECYAVSIVHNDKRFVFSADTYDEKPLLDIVKDADLFLVDAGLMQKDKTDMSAHFSVKEACELGCHAKKTLLTHFSPIYSKDEILSEVCCGAELSERGKEYRI